jgi:hypothetical protein
MKIVDSMIEKLDKILDCEGDTLTLINNTTSQLSRANVHQLMRTIEFAQNTFA